MMGVTPFALRFRRHLRALGRNPLIRTSDRLESFAVLAVLLIALVAVPVAAQVESHAYDAGMRTVDEQTQRRHSVEALVVEGSTGFLSEFDSPATIRVQWHEGDQLRTEQLTSPVIVEAGAPMTIWLDKTGTVVTAPLTADDVKLSATAAAGTVWVVAVFCSVLAALGIRRWLDRSRARAWENKLNLLAHNDDGWANRHT
jgi:hypothetical protein